MSSPIVNVTVAASSYDLTTLDKVKNELGITDDTFDTLLSAYIKASSSLITTYTDRVFAQETIEEKTQGYGSIELMLTRTPVTSVSTVYIDGALIIDYEISNSKAGLLYREAGWNWTAGLFSSMSLQPAPGREHPSIVVTYVAGYILESFGTGVANLPADIELACNMIVKNIFNARDIDDNVKQVKIGDYSVSYKDSRDALSEEVKNILQPYCRIV